MRQVAVRRGREHFPRRVTSVDELPEPVFSALQQYHAAQDLERLVVIPPQHYAVARRWWRRMLPFGWRLTPHRTLAFGETQIVIIEGTSADALDIIVVPVADLIAIQVDLVLLYSYFQLWWAVDRDVASCKIEFNSVELRLLERGLCSVQQAIAARSAPRQDDLPSPVSTRHFPLKFHNYARTSLLPDETIRFAIHQPALAQPGKFFRPHLAPNRVILLTEQHVLVIEDALPHEFGSGGSTYRINRYYYPRDRVISARAETRDEVDWLVVTIGVAGAKQAVEFPLSQAHAAALQQALDDWFLR